MHNNSFIATVRGNGFLFHKLSIFEFTYLCRSKCAIKYLAHPRTYKKLLWRSRPLEAIAGEAAVEVSLLRREMMDGF